MGIYGWGAGIATGDVHNDGWADVLIALDPTAYGLALYANVNGERFVRQDIPIPSIDRLSVANAALVDLNDDGWLDIVLTSDGAGNSVIYNQNGDFLEANIHALPSNDDGTSVSATFGDIDRDGDLDAVLGYWTDGIGTRPKSSSLILRQRKGGFDVDRLDEDLGGTFSALFSDYNGDGALDLVLGNDFPHVSDVYYFGDNKGGLRQVTRQDGLIPQTGQSTMSVATGDLDNDLAPEMYVAQIARGTGTGFRALTVEPPEVCAGLADRDAQATCLEQTEISGKAMLSLRRRNALGCLEIRDPILRQECIVLAIMGSAARSRTDEFCDLIPTRISTVADLCFNFGSVPRGFRPTAKPDSIPQIQRRNVLLVRRPDGSFEDRAIEAGVEIGGWSWNAKFADLDNDGLKDLYVANGWTSRRSNETNLFYRNLGGLRFSNDTFDYGLADYWVTGAYSYVDFDNDGDLDIISLPVGGPVRVFVNRGRRRQRHRDLVAGP